MDSTDLMECNCRLHEAVLEGNLELIKNIIESSVCNVNEADQNHWNGRTALHLAAMKGNAEIAALLLDNGADVSACDSRGNTPLHWCGHTETIELLVEHGASVLQCNNRGLTPKDMAERRGVCGSAYNLLCHLEVEMKEAGTTGRSSGPPQHSQATHRLTWSSPSKRKRLTTGQFLSGLWQECASEVGSRNFLLLLLGLLALSIYVAFILTGMSFSNRGRIPIEVH